MKTQDIPPLWSKLTSHSTGVHQLIIVLIHNTLIHSLFHYYSFAGRQDQSSKN